MSHELELFNKILKAIEQREFRPVIARIKKNRCKLCKHVETLDGFTDTGRMIPMVDWRECLIPGIIEECLHIILRDTIHPEIKRLRKSIVRKMNAKQVQALLKAICEHGIFTDTEQVFPDAII